MTIASELTKLNTNLTNSYTAVSGKGGTLPPAQNFDNLATAISTIPSGGSAPVITSLSVTPTTSAQTITAPSGTDGYSPINVSAVTASIDNNITAGNIKSGVSILGVTGTYSGTTPTGTLSITANGTYDVTNYANADVNVSGGGSDIGITREVKNGVYQMPTTSFTFSLPNDATDVGNHALHYAFYDCTGLTSVDLSSLTKVSGSSGLNNAFYGCTGLTSVDLSSLTKVSGSSGLNYAFYGCKRLTSVDLSSLTSVGSSGLNYAFHGCTGLTSVDLSSLTSVGSSGLGYAFDNCTGLISVDLSSLTSVGSSGLNNAFYGCTGLTSVDLSSLTSVGSSGLNYAFRYCTGLTDIYFRALTTSSFGSYKNQFNYMMSNTGSTVTHTLHFPSNLESTISGLKGYPLFGGTSRYVVCAFDLPATS